MAIASGDESPYSVAWDIAMRVATSNGGFSQFRKELPDLDKSEARSLWDKIWARADRVKYYERTPGGQFFSKSKAGCTQQSNYLATDYLVDYTDDFGNQRSFYYHQTVRIEKTIGATRDEALIGVVTQIRDQYFQGEPLEQTRARITNYRVVNVKCLTLTGV